MNALIPDKKKVAAALLEYQEIFEGLFNVCNDTETIVCLDASGVIQNINEATAKRFNTTREKLIGTSVWNLFPPEVVQSRQALFDKVLQTGKAMRFEDQRGTVWCDSITYPVYDKDGKIKRIFIIGRDITERKLLEISLKNLKEELEQRVAERTTRLLEANQELESKTKRLEDLNATLRVMLEQRQGDRAELEKNIMNNIKGLVIPTLEKLLSNKLEPYQKEYVKLALSNLNDIMSPFVCRLTKDLCNLTPKQLQIANLIKEGKTSKEIAELLYLSIRTIEVQRDKIRKKLEMKGRQANLKSFLLTLQ